MDPKADARMIPPSALGLGLAGLIPFMAGAVFAVVGTASMPIWAQALAEGDVMVRHYGVVILCFMAGTQWGFATRAQGTEATIGYILSVLPALLTLVALFPGQPWAIPVLAFGFAALLPMDLWFQDRGLAPKWWLRLRLLLSTVVLLCLGLVWQA